MKKYEEIGREVGQLVQEKNEAYGDSFGQSCRILEVLYPDGIDPTQYRDALAITRVIDKLFRLANKKDAFGESPWRDICGYAILGIANEKKYKSSNIDVKNSRNKLVQEVSPDANIDDDWKKSARETLEKVNARSKASKSTSKSKLPALKEAPTTVSGCASNAASNADAPLATSSCFDPYAVPF